jgi:hypothetical protein
VATTTHALRGGFRRTVTLRSCPKVDSGSAIASKVVGPWPTRRSRWVSRETGPMSGGAATRKKAWRGWRTAPVAPVAVLAQTKASVERRIVTLRRAGGSVPPASPASWGCTLRRSTGCSPLTTSNERHLRPPRDGPVPRSPKHESPSRDDPPGPAEGRSGHAQARMYTTTTGALSPSIGDIGRFRRPRSAPLPPASRQCRVPDRTL